MTIDTEYTVSVVIIVRNGDRFLAQAIQSALDQTYPPLEIIVVDGQSTDRTKEIATSFKEVRYVYQETLGISNAYNLGVEHARGNLIAFLSHDDRWTPDKLQLQTQLLRQNPQLQYVVGRVKYFLEPGFELPPGFRKRFLLESPVGYIMETLLARKSLFEQTGGFNPDLPVAEDVDWYARLKDQQIPGSYVDAVVAHKRIHDRNTSTADYRVTHKALMKAILHSLERKRAPHEKLEAE